LPFGVNARRAASLWLALGETCKGWAIHQLGDFEGGLKLLRQGVLRWYVTGAALHTTNWEICLAESYLLQGDAAAARSHLSAARAHCESYGENYLAGEMDRLEALLLQREGATTDLTELCLAKALRVGGVVRRERSRGLAASSSFSSQRDAAVGGRPIVRPVTWSASNLISASKCLASSCIARLLARHDMYSVVTWALLAPLTIRAMSCLPTPRRRQPGSTLKAASTAVPRQLLERHIFAVQHATQVLSL